MKLHMVFKIILFITNITSASNLENESFKEKNYLTAWFKYVSTCFGKLKNSSRSFLSDSKRCSNRKETDSHWIIKLMIEKEFKIKMLLAYKLFEIYYNECDQMISTSLVFLENTEIAELMTIKNTVDDYINFINDESGTLQNSWYPMYLKIIDFLVFFRKLKVKQYNGELEYLRIPKENIEKNKKELNVCKTLKNIFDNIYKDLNGINTDLIKDEFFCYTFLASEFDEKLQHFQNNEKDFVKNLTNISYHLKDENMFVIEFLKNKSLLVLQKSTFNEAYEELRKITKELLTNEKRLNEIIENIKIFEGCYNQKIQKAENEIRSLSEHLILVMGMNIENRYK
ncbi:hypothetical protein EDEG_02055 [Edhazardia aedis USNM 41457]|uniref:Uncharacterized protein n=1 Tax=Edhazardia aedis (strain USNM 41457) TaxID=1003232 RepID=J9D7Z5_EDHAE|nr:hypothetical protein EDEG_02055 [Edhazardia aedis USNM 41457]|eukprot:EJW03624.1 hypothetical protein EDEG_02055 [Edhazardia aedis USNM 41457]